MFTEFNVPIAVVGQREQPVLQQLEAAGTCLQHLADTILDVSGLAELLPAALAECSKDVTLTA